MNILNLYKFKIAKKRINGFSDLSSPITLNKLDIMKKFEKVELEAKNSPAGSYAAGCPTKGGHAKCANNCEIRI